MKSFTIKALAVAAASVCGSAVVAGTATSSNFTYATEGVTASTAITLQPVTYTMGVSRTSAQDFTIVIKPQAGSTLDGSVCDSAKPAAVANGAINDFTVSLKRQSASECAYEVDITNAAGSNTSLAITFTGLKLATHGLATTSTEKLSIGLWDQGESARIDNSADVLVTVANSAAAVGIATGKDTNTSADVNHGSGPLYGFLAETAGPTDADTADIAKAKFYVLNNPSAYKIADGSRAFDVRNANDVTKMTVTIGGDFDGAALTNGAVTGFAVTNPAGVAETVTMNGTATATVTLATGDFLAATTNQSVLVAFTSAKNKSLGTSRSFSVSALVDNTVGADTTVSNSNFWEWTANAIELRSAFFNNDTLSGNLTRFFFQNVGTAAGYQAACQSDADGNTVTYGTAKTGTLRAGQTAINAADICTFSGGKRGSITFTINAPAKNVKGVYQQAVNGTAAGYIPLERPYNGSTY
jgi:hypothetical protein